MPLVCALPVAARCRLRALHARRCAAPCRPSAFITMRAAASSRDDSLIEGPAAVRDSAVLISGGGMSGLGAAATLVAAGVDTVLCEQGRGLGGRVCTRRVRGQPLSFDHGCQYFAPKAEPFAAVLAELESAGIVARWGEGGRLGAVACDAAGRIDWRTYVPHEPSKVRWVIAAS